MKKETIDKTLFLLFLLIVSAYFSTAIHETGHAVIYSIECESTKITINFPLPYGLTESENCEKMTDLKYAISLSAGILFVSLTSLILFLIFVFSRKIKNMSNTLTIIYFLSYGCSMNGFLQAIASSDTRILFENFGVQTIYWKTLSIIIGGIILFQIYKFKDVLRLNFSLMKERRIKMATALLLAITIGYSLIYLLIR